MSGSGGAGTAIELLGGLGLGLGDDDGDELAPDLFEPAGVPAAIPAAARPAAQSGPKGGRPKGARNRSTEQWRRYLQGRYQSPLVGLAETWSRTPRQLAEDLELYRYHEGKPVLDATGAHVLDTGAAAALQHQARVAALPYWHQKQPVAIEARSEARGVMLIGHFDADQASSDVPSLPMIADEQNQQVSDAEVVQSDAIQSDATTNALQTREKTDEPR